MRQLELNGSWPLNRRRLLTIPALIVAATALNATIAARDAHAVVYAPCSLSLQDRSPPGGTPAYNLSVKKRKTSCLVAKRVMRSFHRCRMESGISCGRKVLKTWRCSGRKDAGAPTFRGTFTCSSGSRRVIGSYEQDTPRCFGAPARDPLRPCFNPTTSMFPAPSTPDPDETWKCDASIAPGACVFGTDADDIKGHFALVGDSHALHWRPALNVVARVKRWRGYSLDTGGCFFSAAVGAFSTGCISFYEHVLSWISRHPEIDTVFVTQNADTPVAVPPGTTSLEVKVDGFRRAWAALPKTVKRVIVLHDTTITTDATFTCVVRVVTEGRQRPGTTCPLERSFALRQDTAVETVRRLRSKRYASIDLSRYLCGPRHCYPVIGGVLVNGDVWGHLNSTFMRTLGPYLLREIERLEASW